MSRRGYRRRLPLASRHPTSCPPCSPSGDGAWSRHNYAGQQRQTVLLLGFSTTVLPMAEALHNIMDPGWADALEPAAGQIAAMGEFLRAEVAAGRRYLPAGDNVLRAFKQPFDSVRVLIVGQDPYPTPGNAVGLSFSVAPQVRPLPGSLVNIFREYSDDLGYPAPATGDLVPWSERGVLLLNRVLTVAPGQPGSHRGNRWWRSCGAATRGRSRRCSGTSRGSSRRIRARFRRRAVFTAHIRSAVLISCWNSKAPNRSTGNFLNYDIPGQLAK